MDCYIPYAEDNPEPWLVAFRQWTKSPTFPSWYEEHQAEWAFRAGWLARETEIARINRNMKAHREIAVAAIAGTEQQLQALRSELKQLRTAACELLMRSTPFISALEMDHGADGEDLYRALADAAHYVVNDGAN